MTRSTSPVEGVVVNFPGFENCTLRTLTNSDSGTVRDFYQSLSPDSIRARFRSYCVPKNYPEAIFCAPSAAPAPIILGILDSPSGKLLGIGECIPDSLPESAPLVALLVRDDARRKGLGWALFREILSEGARQGFREFNLNFDVENGEISILVQKLFKKGVARLLNGESSKGESRFLVGI